MTFGYPASAKKRTDERTKWKWNSRLRNRKVNIGMPLQRVNWRIGLIAKTTRKKQKRHTKREANPQSKQPEQQILKWNAASVLVAHFICYLHIMSINRILTTAIEFPWIWNERYSLVASHEKRMQINNSDIEIHIFSMMYWYFAEFCSRIWWNQHIGIH